MRPAEKALLMLTCALGQHITPLSAIEYRELAKRIRACQRFSDDADVTAAFLRELGYGEQEADRILTLLEREDVLAHYLDSPGLSAVTRISAEFPQRLRKLGKQCPHVLFCKGDSALLSTRCVALVGSRRLPERNRRFAERIGALAAKQGLTLVSGGAVGADSAAQNACLTAGGRVICFVPDALDRYPVRKNVLFCSVEGREFAFSSARALYRNHLIHCLGEKTFVACCPSPHGGTWSGTSHNLQHRLSDVYILDDDSEGVRILTSMGAHCVCDDIESIEDLLPTQLSIFD